MTVDRDSVLQAIRELYAEEDRWLFAKDVSVRMGLKGSGPIAKVVRKELESLAKDGLIDTEAESGFGRRFKAREGPPAEDPEPEEEPAEEQEEEPARRRGGRAPAAVRRLLALLSERPLRMVVLKGEGVDPKTVRKCVMEGWVDRVGADGYAITSAGRERLAEIDEAYPDLARPETVEPQPVERADPLNCVQGPSPDPANCGPEPEPVEPQPTEAKAEAKAEVEEPAPVPVPEPEYESESESKSEPEPEPEPDVMNPMSKLAGIPEDEEPDDPPIGEAVNAVVVSAQAAALLHVRTPEGPMLVCAPIDPRVLGQMSGMADVVGRAIRLRENNGRMQVGHIVDDVWRDAL